VVEVFEQEANLTPTIALHAMARLVELGHHVIVLSDGDYADRHKRVNRYAAGRSDTVYCALHLNAGGGSWGLWFFDYRSQRGPALARAIAKAHEDTIDELNGDCRAVPCKADGWTKNAFYTIKGVDPVAICCEPAFLDQPSHATLFDHKGLRRLGTALAEGIHAWGVT
jgi:N-acetylmuramoyl-L-alanine amidase